MTNDVAPTVSRPTPALVRKLARIRTGDGRPPKTLSLFIDLRPGTFAIAGARVSQINSIYASAQRVVDGLEPDDRKALRKDLDRVRDFLQDDAEWALDAGGVAVFVSSRAGLFEVLKMPVPVAQRVVVEEGPFIEPLVPLIQSEMWCVALVNRRIARFFLGTDAGIHELDQMRDDVHGQHDQGGWSQARYERGIEVEVDVHLRNVAARLLDLKRRGQFSKLLVGTTEELWPRLEKLMHSYVRQAFVGRFDIDVENVEVDLVQEQLERVVLIEDNAREKNILARLRSELGRNRRAVAGLDSCLAALNDARVEILLIDAGIAAEAGVLCSKCSWLGLSGKRCPIDGTALEATDDIIEKALEKSLSESGEVMTIRFHKDLQGLGSMAALLRF